MVSLCPFYSYFNNFFPFCSFLFKFLVSFQRTFHSGFRRVGDRGDELLSYEKGKERVSKLLWAHRHLVLGVWTWDF